MWCTSHTAHDNCGELRGFHFSSKATAHGNLLSFEREYYRFNGGAASGPSAQPLTSAEKCRESYRGEDVRKALAIRNFLNVYVNKSLKIYVPT
jgi:hypothetical protein